VGKNVSLRSVPLSFIKSLTWVAVIISCSSIFWIVTNLIKVDFVHINPNRPQDNAILMMFLYPPTLLVIAFIGVALVFTVSQLVQTFLASVLLRRYGSSGLIGVVLCLPLVSILTWYCFDYLTPTDFNLGINAGAEWVPYQHGLTIQRYLLTLLAQSCVTAFSLVRLALEIQDRNKVNTYVLMVAIIFAASCGSVSSYMR